jgi:hypothetical protein
MENKSKTRPFQKPRRVGHPENRNHSLGVDVLEWYDFALSVRHKEKREMVGHPPANVEAMQKLNPLTSKD